MLAQSNYQLESNADLENLEDLRIHATLYPTTGSNLYRVCLAGIRRQRYWFNSLQKDQVIKMFPYLNIDDENK